MVGAELLIANGPMFPILLVSGQCYTLNQMALRTQIVNIYGNINKGYIMRIPGNLVLISTIKILLELLSLFKLQQRALCELY